MGRARALAKLAVEAHAAAESLAGPGASFVGPGTVLGGRYELVRRIGRGAMGVVHEARTVKEGLPVALKLLRTELIGEGKAAYRFAREARLSARIESPHVVRTLDAGVDDKLSVPWLCMELVPHGHLVEWLETHGPLDRARAVSVLRQVFHALAAAHRAAIVHRDLKPENILVAQLGDGDAAPTVKVSDFGIAKGLHDQSWSVTEAGLGTPLWTAPEQGREGYLPSPRSDVWALGLIAYWILTGRQYWRAADGRGSVIDVVVEMQRSVFDPPSARALEQGVSERIPPDFDAWFARAVTNDIEARFADAGQAWEALESVLSERQATTPEPASRQRAVLLVGGVVVLLVALAVAALALLQR